MAPRFPDTELLVLAGGAGRRLGQGPKALVPVAGRTFVQRALDLAPHFSGARLIVADRPALVAALGPIAEASSVPLVLDRLEGGGAPAGLEAGLAACDAPWAFALACDMPFVTPAAIAKLHAAREGANAVVPVAGGRRHPLHALYRVAAARPVARAVAEAGGRLMDVLDRLDARAVDLEGDAGSVANVNTPEALAAAERALRGADPAV
jgi:molybdenum cofactor guanylyltransferase